MRSPTLNFLCDILSGVLLNRVYYFHYIRRINQQEHQTMRKKLIISKLDDAFSILSVKTNEWYNRWAIDHANNWSGIADMCNRPLKKVPFSLFSPFDVVPTAHCLCTHWNPRSATHFAGRRLRAVARLLTTTELVRSCMITSHSKFQGAGFPFPL